MNKKSILSLSLATLSLVIMAGCQTTGKSNSSGIATNTLSGVWFCETSFPNNAALSKQQINFNSNNKEYQSIGQIGFKMNNGSMLAFEQVSAGKWSLLNNEYSIVPFGSRGKPANEGVRQQMANNKQIKENLTPIMKLLNTGPNPGVSFQVDQMTNETFTYHTIIKGATVTTNCKKIPTESILPALKNNPENISNYIKQNGG